MKIAVSGKGGVGKTMISANLAKLFAKNGYHVLAVDADPDSCLGFALGIDDALLESIVPIGNKEDLIREKMGEGAMFSLNPIVDDITDRFSIDTGSGIRFIRMGGIKKGGESCYCRENSFLQAVVSSLILDTKDVVIMDMGAGIEHLTRGTSSGMDLMIVVVEPGKSSVQTGRTVQRLAHDVGVKKVVFIANKVRSSHDEDFLRQNFSGEELLGMIHYNDTIALKGMGEGQTPNEIDDPEIESVLTRVLSA